MSFRLIDSNSMAIKYPEVNELPCVYADLPNGLDGSFITLQWTPVTKRLPEEERKNYWICTDTGHQCECRWTNNCFGIGESDEWGWSIFDIPRYSHVVAWMPLPMPWKGEEDGHIFR